ncbi:MAG: hypothetical protein R3C56_27710 [Pirellulaceae bacterium]
MAKRLDDFRYGFSPRHSSLAHARQAGMGPMLSRDVWYNEPRAGGSRAKRASGQLPQNFPLHSPTNYVGARRDSSAGRE